MSYLGDADVGARTNVGAGTITANYDGRRKHRTTIGERVFLGVDTMLVAPLDDRRRGQDRGRRGGDPRRARRASSRSACRPGSASRASRRRAAAGAGAADGGGGTGPMNLPISELVVIVLLTLLEGFFVAAEIALVSVRRSRVEQLVDEGVRGARRVRRLLEDPGRFLAVSQLGLTFLGFFASAFAAVSLTERPDRAARARSTRCATSPQPISLVVVTVAPGPLHDRLRRARPEDPRPRPPGAVRAVGRAGRSTTSPGCFGPVVALLTGTTRADHPRVRGRRDGRSSGSAPRS